MLWWSRRPERRALAAVRNVALVGDVENQEVADLDLEAGQPEVEKIGEEARTGVSGNFGVR